jgi:hypothetical protein
MTENTQSPEELEKQKKRNKGLMKTNLIYGPIEVFGFILITYGYSIGSTALKIIGASIMILSFSFIYGKEKELKKEVQKENQEKK